MFSIDGLTWEVRCKIERVTELPESDASGMMLNRSYLSDVWGTWVRYTVSIAVPFGREEEYYAIRDRLDAPVEGHTFVMPFNADFITFAGRVLSVRDVLYETSRGNYWEGCTFEAISNDPIKVPTIGGET